MVAATATEMLPAIGQMVLVRCELLDIRCEIKDVRTAWGRNQFLVTPLAGHGHMWVELGRLTMEHVPNWNVLEVRS